MPKRSLCVAGGLGGGEKFSRISTLRVEYVGGAGVGGWAGIVVDCVLGEIVCSVVDGGSCGSGCSGSGWVGGCCIDGVDCVDV